MKTPTIFSTDAPQVVADERAAQYAGVPYEFHDRYHVEKTEGGFWPYCVKCGDGSQSLYVGTLKQCELVASRLFGAFADGYFVAFPAAPVQAQEPVAYRWPDGPGKFYYQDVSDPVADFARKTAELLYRAPVQPVAVPDGPYTFPIGEDGEYMILDKDGRQVGTVLYYHVAKAIAAALAAPAAQGAAKCNGCGATAGADCNDRGCGGLDAGNGEPAAQGDAISKVEVDDQGPLGVVTKTTYRLANAGDAKDTERMDFLVMKIVDVRQELRYGSRLEFTSQAQYDDDEFTGTTLRAQIDAAIAAKAAS